MQTLTISATPVDPTIDMSALMTEIEEALGLVSGAIFHTQPEQPPEPQQPDPALQNLPAAGTQRQSVLLALLSHTEGLTRDELAEVLGGIASRADCDRRLRELRQGDFVEVTSERRATPFGGEAKIVRATDKARLKVRLSPAKWLAGKPRPEGC